MDDTVLQKVERLCDLLVQDKAGSNNADGTREISVAKISRKLIVRLRIANVVEVFYLWSLRRRSLTTVRYYCLSRHVIIDSKVVVSVIKVPKNRRAIRIYLLGNRVSYILIL